LGWTVSARFLPKAAHDILPDRVLAYAVFLTEFARGHVTARISHSDSTNVPLAERRSVIGIPFGSLAQTCPVRSVQAWLESARITEGAVLQVFGQISAGANQEAVGKGRGTNRQTAGESSGWRRCYNQSPARIHHTWTAVRAKCRGGCPSARCATSVSTASPPCACSLGKNWPQSPRASCSGRSPADCREPRPEQIDPAIGGQPLLNEPKSMSTLRKQMQLRRASSPLPGGVQPVSYTISEPTRPEPISYAVLWL
jgi:hypothetical protein